jgi:hypothetical protein
MLYPVTESVPEGLHLGALITVNKKEKSPVISLVGTRQPKS